MCDTGKEKVKISVIMGIFNCANTLPEAIESILKQTYSDWELIMCDDGSTDETYQVALRYQQQNPDRIVVIQNEKNMGLNYTLNHCLKYSDGELIARMDGDDISLPERFQKEVDFLDNHPEYAIVSTQMIYFDADGPFRTGTGEGEPSKESLTRGTPFCHAPCMVRREAYEAVGGYAVTDHRLRVEDWDLWVRMYSQGFRGYNLSEALYMMRDDRNAENRRKFKYRLNESRVSASAVKLLHLSTINYVWFLRPIIVGLLPKSVYRYLHRRKMNG